MPLRCAIYSFEGVAVGYVTQDGDIFRVELLRQDGSACAGGNFSKLLPAVLKLLDATDGEDHA